MFRLFKLSTTLVVSILLFACGSSDKKQASKSIPEPARKATVGEKAPIQSFSPQKTDYSGYYVGTINSNFPVQMELTLTGDSAALAGSYYYESSAKPLSLRGKLTSKALTITETNHEAVKTGSFNGQLTAPNRFEGVWKNSSGKKNLPFGLKRVASYQAKQEAAAKASTRSIIPTFLSKSRPLGNLNETLKAEAVKRSQEFLKNGEEFAVSKNSVGWEMSQDCKITFYSEELISLMTTIYEYSGGAHGNTGYSTNTYRVSGEKLIDVSLADLFVKNSNYLQTLSKLVVNELKKQNAPEVVSGRIATFNAEDLKNFFLTSKSIKFVFEPYAVGPYAAGTYFAEIPYGQLNAIINADGPLKPLL
ncbi:MAG: DUF3298 domain-containing protein [Calditrichia bacterium]